MNTHDYWTEIASIVEQVKADTLEQGFTWDWDAEEYADQRLGEVIDGHEFCICYSKALEVLQHTATQDAMLDTVGEESAIRALRDGGLGGLHCAMSVWAMIADCTSHSDWTPAEWIVEEEEQDDED